MDQKYKIEKIKEWLGTGSINIFGLPFSGKDTQGKQLAHELDASLIGGGDILRSNSMPGHIKDYMLAGEMTPTDEYISIVIPYLSRQEFTGKPIVLNSVGRWHGEEDYVLHAANSSNHQLKVVVELKLDEQTAKQRQHELPKIQDRGNRIDDTESILEKRMKEYKEKTQPVIEAYREMGIVVSIDATKSRDEVHEEIINSLYEKASHVEA